MSPEPPNSRRALAAEAERPKNSSTCTPCRLRRVRCNRMKPCSTCVTRGIADQCDSPLQPASPYMQRAADGPGLRNEIDRIRRMADVLERLRPSAATSSAGSSRPPSGSTPSFRASRLPKAAESRADHRLAGSGAFADGGPPRSSDVYSAGLGASVPEWIGSTYRPGAPSAPSPAPFDTSAFFPSTNSAHPHAGSFGNDFFPSPAGGGDLLGSYSLYDSTSGGTPYGTLPGYFGGSPTPGAGGAAGVGMGAVGGGGGGSDVDALAAALDVQPQADRELLRQRWGDGYAAPSASAGHGQSWSFGGY